MSLEKLTEIRRLITELDAELFTLLESNPELEKACEILAEMNFLKRDFSSVYDSFSFSVSGLMGATENVSLTDGTEIEKKSSYDRKAWDHKSLASAVADKLTKMAVDMDTGEVIKSPREIAMEMVTYCAPSYWRIKELNKIGINADNYCEVGELKTSVIVRKSKTANNE